ncbi:hypothetical protein DPMN_130952 [Dreissena polymorpha]|uniref:Uncharacterized protein n=1 Tax=Dreissena polymorpha TaxID=45954 RepID=A0A9D4JZL8_DREPO|nr:hypothetical protein DPMN_130952 [Dreissena polymorpha]
MTCIWSRATLKAIQTPTGLGAQQRTGAPDQTGRTGWAGATLGAYGIRIILAWQESFVIQLSEEKLLGC